MKLRKEESGYNVLHNDNGLPVLCKKRTPVEVPIQEQSASTFKRPEMSIMSVFPTACLCGDHCPFFIIIKPLINNKISYVKICCEYNVVSHNITGSISNDDNSNSGLDIVI